MLCFCDILLISQQYISHISDICNNNLTRNCCFPNKSHQCILLAKYRCCLAFVLQIEVLCACSQDKWFIGYVDLADFCEIFPKQSRDIITNKSMWCCSEKKRTDIFSFGIHLHVHNTSHFMFSYSNFRCGYLDNQSDYWKSLMPGG